MRNSITRTAAIAFAASLLATTAMMQTATATPEEGDHMTISESVSTNAVFNDFLNKYGVQQGDISLVRYNAVTAEDKAALEGYIAKLSKSGPPSGSDEEIMAYWFNLYNAETINVILNNYPVKSIREIGGSFVSKGPWGDKTLTVNGTKMSLNNIEHDTVRATYDEPRIHYAFNCASISCPDLRLSAWEAETLDADLSAAATAYINSDRGVSVDNKGNLTVSSIFKWYKGDFVNNGAGVFEHLEQYATGDKKAAITAAGKIKKYDYDWNLNETK